MTDLERLELALRRLENRVDNTWMPSELLSAMIEEVMKVNIEAEMPSIVDMDADLEAERSE